LALIGLLMMKFKFMSGAIVANAGLILIMILVYFSSL
jgi:hypothetical protein